MAFDFKKEYKECYMPKDKPEIVTVPAANYSNFQKYRSSLNYLKKWYNRIREGEHHAA